MREEEEEEREEGEEGVARSKLAVDTTVCVEVEGVACVWRP